MGLRLHKTLGLAKGLKLNFSKTGMSLSAGQKGMTVNFSSKGVKSTIGAPGTGISYSRYTRWRDNKPAEQGSRLGTIFMMAVIILVMIFVIGKNY